MDPLHLSIFMWIGSLSFGDYKVYFFPLWIPDSYDLFLCITDNGNASVQTLAPIWIISYLVECSW